MRTIIFRIALVLLFCTIGIVLLFQPYFCGNEKGSFEGLSLNEDSIKKVLQSIEDPEIPLNIVDLGLIRNIKVEKEGKVKITMIYTAPACPFNDFLVNKVKEKIGEIKDVENIEVFIERDETWTPDMMTEKGKKWFKENVE
jgi:metal-sulfur cluster biosynthetic enzyme